MHMRSKQNGIKTIMKKNNPWVSPKIQKPEDDVNVLIKSIVDGVKYYHIAYYNSKCDEWYTNTSEDDELLYSEHIVGWMHLPE